MKKFLLSALAVMAAMSGFAQDKATLNAAKSPKMEISKTCVKQYKPTATRDTQSSQMFKAPRKSYDSGLWYARPQGSYWLSGQYYDDNEELQSYKYLVVPPFTEMKFLNASTDPANTQWFMGTTEQTEESGVDENFNYSRYFYKLPAGYVGYTPTLKKGEDTYQAAEYVLVCDSMPQFVHAFNYLDGHRYYGYSDGRSAFQSGPDVFDWDGDDVDDTFYIENFLQYFDKPLSPTLLYDVVLWATAPNNKIGNIGDLQLVFRSWDWEKDDQERDVRVLGDTIKILHCTSAEFETEFISTTAKVYPGTLVFAAEEEDEFGTPTATPFVLDSNYAIELSGFGLDEMDIRFYFTDQGECIEEYESWATPTFLTCCDEEGNRLGRLSYWNDYTDTKTGEIVRYCYSIAYMFDVVMDGAMVEESTATQYAPAEGGESYLDANDQTGATYFLTNLPIFEIDGEDATWTGNYDFDGIPEWATIQIDPTYYDNMEIEGAEDLRGLNLVWFDVQPLPEGVTGRSATIKVFSATGIECMPITLIQGEVEQEGINTIKYDANGKFVSSYNLSGQKVGNNFKGIVIKDGKKVLK